MDENKLKKLHEVQYEITRVCANCHHFRRHNTPNGHVSALFSVCMTHKYTYKKHTGVDRQLSVHATGTCKDHKMSERVLDQMHEFAKLRRD